MIPNMNMSLFLELDKSKIDDPFIRQMFSKTELVQLRGASSGHVIISPKDAVDVKAYPIIKKHEHWFFLYDLNKGAKLLHPSMIFNSGANIYKSGIKFPDFCPVCMDKAEKIVLAEVKYSVQGTSKISINERDPDRGRRIIEALGCARYWLTIPFCNKHDFTDKAISIEESKKSIIVKFANAEYGKLFQEVNKTKGIWVVNNIFFNNPEEVTKMNEQDPEWKKKILGKRLLLQILNWSSLAAFMFILFGVFNDFSMTVLNGILEVVEGNLLLVIGALLMAVLILMPWIVISRKIAQKGNFPFGKSNVSGV